MNQFLDTLIFDHFMPRELKDYVFQTLESSYKNVLTIASSNLCDFSVCMAGMVPAVRRECKYWQYKSNDVVTTLVNSWGGPGHGSTVIPH